MYQSYASYVGQHMLKPSVQTLLARRGKLKFLGNRKVENGVLAIQKSLKLMVCSILSYCCHSCCLNRRYDRFVVSVSTSVYTFQLLQKWFQRWAHQPAVVATLSTASVLHSLLMCFFPWLRHNILICRQHITRTIERSCRQQWPNNEYFPTKY